MPQLSRDGQLRAALDAAARGWHVFPLIPDSKRPAVRDWENRASTDRERIARCWQAAPYNVGVATGPSQLVVVDLDTPKGPDDVPPADWSLPGVTEGSDVLALISERVEQPYPGCTFTVRTGRGGTHLYFRTPSGKRLRNTGGKLGWKVDTRANGGYVVAAGSVVDSRLYEPILDIEPARLPGWLVDALTIRPAPSPLARIPSGVPGRRAVGLVRTVLEAGEGERNNRLYWAALRAFESGAEAAAGVAAALLDAAVSVGLSETEARATVASAERRIRGGR
ncbi:bifunctional DNA primase/polymerase [Streptomyces sp. NPDC096193]|uniref:bifunctional DNA primase/polymerase n=1 Tax=Streptomyces sp. NPDC096193 TaxID=3155821 RepID=UPI0033238A69